jgi:hypothetical protein
LDATLGDSITERKIIFAEKFREIVKKDEK